MDPPFNAPSPEEFAQGYIEFFEPDVFVEARAGLAGRIGLARTDLDFGHSRIVPLEEFFVMPNGPYPFSIPFGVDSFEVYRSMYEREFKFVARHAHRVALFDADPVASPFIEAAFGGFPVEGPLAPLERAYTDVFAPVQLAPNAENWVKIVRDGFQLPLGLTTQGLKTDHAGRDMPTLFVVDPTSPLDLIDFWNLRLFHPKVLPVSLTWLQDAKEYLAELVSAIR